MIGPPAAAVLTLDRLMRGNLLAAATLRAMREGLPVDVPTARPEAPTIRRPWTAPSYGLGLMTEAAAPSVVGHSGRGPGSTAAIYHFPAGRPCVTAAAFAPIDEEALVEHRAIEIARGLQG